MCEHARGNEAQAAEASGGSLFHYRAYTTFRALFGELQRRIKPRAEHTPEHIADVASLLETARVDVNEWSQFTNWNDAKYTRSLVAHDPNFTVLLLCWNRGQRSPIHDHAGSSCWVKVIDGVMRERRFMPKGDGSLDCISDACVNTGGVCYINDSMGLHDMGVVNAESTCVSMHVYCPPYYYCNAYAMDGAKRQVSMLAATAPRRENLPASCNIRGHVITESEAAAASRGSPIGAISIRELCDTLDNASSTKEECEAAFGKTYMSPDDWRYFAHFNDTRFQRLLLHENRRFSLLMLCWLKDQKTPKHDHEGCESWVKVLSGSLSLTTFTPDAATGDEIVATTPMTPESTQHGFHEGPELPLHVVQCTHDFAVSLHLYTPPYTECHYSAEGGAHNHGSEGHVCEEKKSLPSVCCQTTARISNVTALSEKVDKFFNCNCTCCSPAQHAEFVLDVLASFHINLREVDRFYQQRHIHGYTVRLAETPTSNIILNLWDPEATTVAHDHDGSTAFILTVSGVVYDTAYDLPTEANPRPRVSRTSRLSRGQVCYYTPSSIHSIRNNSKDNYAATLHVYQKPCRAANWYSLALDTKPMRVTAERGRSPTRGDSSASSSQKGSPMGESPVGDFNSASPGASMS